MASLKSTLSGTYYPASHEKGPYWYFVPNPLPPQMAYDNELFCLAMEAQRYLSELGARSSQIVSPEMFINTFMRKEAEFSCQIEGTVSSIRDALEEEAGIKDGKHSDHLDIVNYLKALNKGLDTLKHTEITEWFIRTIHEQLIEHQPYKNPGKLRDTQNQIGGITGDPTTADFVPPDPLEMKRSLEELIKFINTDDVNLPPLIKIALIHAQFETIHPFDDGNGRAGRQLITFQLCKEKIIDKPVLYLSYYFRKNKEAYISHLQSIHDKGTWEAWLKFFLQGVIETCKNALSLANKIDDLTAECDKKIRSRYVAGKAESPRSLLIGFFLNPIMSVPYAEQHLRRSKSYVYDLFQTFCDLGIIREITNQGRNKKYEFFPYLELLETAEM